MPNVNVGVNEYVYLNASEMTDYALQTSGLAGCCVLVVYDREECYMAHISDERGANWSDQRLKILNSVAQIRCLWSGTAIVLSKSKPDGEQCMNATKVQELLRDYLNVECNYINGRCVRMKWEGRPFGRRNTNRPALGWQMNTVQWPYGSQENTSCLGLYPGRCRYGKLLETALQSERVGLGQNSNNTPPEEVFPTFDTSSFDRDRGSDLREIL